jgi:four helix bundle protein
MGNWDWGMKKMNLSEPNIMANSTNFSTGSLEFFVFLGGSAIASVVQMAYQPSPERARTLALQKRSFEFTCAIIRAYPQSRRIDDASRIIWRELVKAASSSTFNLEEADAATSDSDSVAKMRIACREAKEARVAIRIIAQCQLEAYSSIVKYEDEANQLASIFSAIVRNKKESMKQRRS